MNKRPNKLPMNYELDYQRLLIDIVTTGTNRLSRTGVTTGLFNKQLTADLANGFPMITGRNLFWKNVKWEAEWMLRGDTNIDYLNAHGVHIWDKFADENGELGPTYGAQLHKQWNRVMETIIDNPYSRRLLINLWSIDELSKMYLPPCYYALQYYYDGERLNLTVGSRSSDAAVGLPYDMAVCAYLLHVACIQTNHTPGVVAFTMCDVHINIENIPRVNQYLEQTIYPLPKLTSQLELINYMSSKTIAMIVKP